MIRTICFRRRSKFKMWFLTVTGESTRWTFDSSTRISRALEHKALTSDSLMISQRRSCSICRSKSLISRQNLIQRPRIIFFKFDKRQLMKDRSVSTNFSFLLCYETTVITMYSFTKIWILLQANWQSNFPSFLQISQSLFIHVLVISRIFIFLFLS